MYFVIEMQKADNGNCSLLKYHDDGWTFQQAQSTFYDKCKYAAISALPKHTVMLMDVEGAVYETKVFSH